MPFVTSSQSLSSIISPAVQSTNAGAEGCLFRYSSVYFPRCYSLSIKFDVHNMKQIARTSKIVVIMYNRQGTRNNITYLLYFVYSTYHIHSWLRGIVLILEPALSDCENTRSWSKARCIGVIAILLVWAVYPNVTRIEMRCLFLS